jgi:uroporphyrinogen-III synthase
MSALAGKRIVITRAPHQTDEFEQLLRERGAVPLAYPCIDIAPPENSTPFDDGLRSAANGVFDWLVLTSVNAAQAVANRLTTLGLKLPALKTAAVGPATAEAARHLLGLEASFIPEIYTAEALANMLRPVSEMQVLLPQSAIADDTLAQVLHSAGANVVAVEAYQTVIGSGGVNLPALLKSNNVDAVTFTSPSAVRNLIRRFKIEGGSVSLVDRVCIACIGTKTAAAARENGFAVSAMPDEHTIPGLVLALERHFDIEMGQDVQNNRRTNESF